MHRFASALLIDARGWLLMQERDAHARIAPNKWGLPGGHVDEGESFESAAYREVAEETGLILEPGVLALYDDVEFFHAEYGTTDRMQIYLARVDATDADVVVGEGKQIVFVEPNAALGLDLTPSAASFLAAFFDSQDYRDLP